MPEIIQNIPEGTHPIEGLSSVSRIEDIIKVAPEYSDKIRRYDSQISSLSPEEQTILIEKWKQEAASGTANMGVFGRLIREFRTRERLEEKTQVQGKEIQIQGEKVQVQGEKVQVQGEKVQVQGERDKYKEKYDRVIVATEGALKSGEKIQSIIGDTYTSEINAKIQKDKSEIDNPNSEVAKLLSSMGIEASQALTTPGVENILRARALTQVYITNQDTITRSHPELKNEIREFEGYRFDLGIQESIQAKNVTKILSDIPGDTRGKVVDTVTSLTRANPETVVTRTGDKLSFVDPKNEKYSYEIDLSREPPKLAKSLNGLSISRNIEPLTEGKKELAKLEGDIPKLTAAINGQKTSESIATIAGVDTSLLDEQTKDGKNPEDKQTLEQYLNTKKSLAQILKEGNPTEKLQAIQKMQQANYTLDGTRRKMINTENMDNPKQAVLEQSLWEEQEALTYLGTLYQQLVDTTGRIQGLREQTKNEGNNEDFEKNALYNLNFLSYIGYDSLGQDNMERIIRALNNPANPKRSEIGEINLNQKLDTPKTQALTLAIANLVRGGRTENDGKTKTPDEEKHETSQKTWDNVDKTDPIIAARQTQSLGFRESLISVRRNMTQEGGSLKTNSQLERVLYGKNSDEGINNSAINTVTGSDSSTSFA